MRLREGGERVAISIDGTQAEAMAGESVAAALFALGIVSLGTGADGTRRGAFCGIGVCHDCRVTIDGQAGQRACLRAVAPGMAISCAAPFRPEAHSLADLAPVPAGELPMRETDVAVVGAGEAGMAAAEAVAAAGLRVVVLDEQFVVPAVPAGVMLEPETLVWGAFRDDTGAGELALLHRGVASRLAFRWLVVATGAAEVPQPVPGWTLPGVMTAGACQAMLRRHGVAPGRRVLFAGTGPLQIEAACELRRAGGGVAGLVDTAAASEAIGDGRALAGVQVLWRHALRRIEGDGRVQRAFVAPLAPDGSLGTGPEVVIATDAVCLGGGFAPASVLPRLLGCLDPVPHAEDGSTSLPDVFVVGAAAGVLTAGAAAAHGALAATEILRRAGRKPPPAQGTVTRTDQFLSAPMPMPMPDDPAAILCRCEAVPLGRLRDVTRAHDLQDVASLKRLTRAGMGRCQGLYCAPHLARLVGAAPGTRAALLAPQMPLRPVPLASLAIEKPEWGGHRRSLLPDDRVAAAAPLPMREAATVVIGAGIVGIATAYFLASAGLDVVVIDAGHAHAMASGGNAGSLHVQLLSFDYGAKAESGGSPAARTLALQRDAVVLWRQLERTTNTDFDISITGGVMVAETEQDLRFLAAKTALERANGIACEMIGPGDLARLEPHLAPGLLGAAYCPAEGKINPLLASPALLQAARAAGARVFEGTSLRAVTAGRTGFVLATNRGELRAGRVVNAAGAFAARVAAMLGLRVPVFGAPLQMVVTEPAGTLVRGLVAHADRHLTLKQATNGNLIIGGGWTATLDPVQQRPRPLRESLEGNLWVAHHVVPALRRLHVLRSWAAMNINIDGAPILGEHPAQPGWFDAVSSNGYTLGPILGQLTAELILRGRCDRDIRPFAVTRFG